MAGRDVAAAVSALPALPFSGSVWRAHRARYLGGDAGGSLFVSGRYNRGTDRFPREQSWPALYCGLTRDVCLGEIVRHVSADVLPLLNEYLLSELHVQLAAVLDCCDSTMLGIDMSELLHDYNLELSQGLAEAARNRRTEGILVPSATLLGNVLVIFPDRLREGSGIEVVNSRPMRLYVDRQ